MFDSHNKSAVRRFLRENSKILNLQVSLFFFWFASREKEKDRFVNSHRYVVHWVRNVVFHSHSFVFLYFFAFFFFQLVLRHFGGEFWCTPSTFKASKSSLWSECAFFVRLSITGHAVLLWAVCMREWIRLLQDYILLCLIMNCFWKRCKRC